MTACETTTVPVARGKWQHVWALRHMLVHSEPTRHNKQTVSSGQGEGGGAMQHQQIHLSKPNELHMTLDIGMCESRADYVWPVCDWEQTDTSSCQRIWNGMHACEKSHTQEAQRLNRWDKEKNAFITAAGSDLIFALPSCQHLLRDRPPSAQAGNVLEPGRLRVTCNMCLLIVRPLFLPK